MKPSHFSVAALLLMSAHTVSAASINGDIAFGTTVGGYWTPADSSLSTGGSITTANADGVIFHDGSDPTSVDDGVVTSAFGDYAGTLGVFVDFSNFVFNPLATGTQLWTIDSGGSTYSFSMLTISIVSQTSNSISLEGTGIASITGFDDRSGDFTLTLNQNSRAFSFSSSASVAHMPVPAAVWLFGSGLVGVLGIARRKQAA